jgi:hypothetical protein
VLRVERCWCKAVRSPACTAAQDGGHRQRCPWNASVWSTSMGAAEVELHASNRCDALAAVQHADFPVIRHLRASLDPLAVTASPFPGRRWRSRPSV